MHDAALLKVFPYETEEEKRLMDLLDAAYIQGHYRKYNDDFVVLKEDLEALGGYVADLQARVMVLCLQRLGRFIPTRPFHYTPSYPLLDMAELQRRPMPDKSM